MFRLYCRLQSMKKERQLLQFHGVRRRKKDDIYVGRLEKHKEKLRKKYQHELIDKLYLVMMADDLTFSKVCGENVKLNNERKAEWRHVYSGGILLSRKPLTKRSSVTCVELNGSSHVDIGFVDEDPSRFERVRDIYDQNFTVLNSIKLHRRKSRVKMFVRDDMVVSVYGDKEFQLQMTGSEIWMAIYIKFGDATATGEDRFNDVCGENIEFLPDSNKTAAKLRILNPAAICMVHNTMSPEATFRLKVRINPLLDNGKPPSRYHVAFGISGIPPFKWHDSDCESLSISQRNTNPVSWCPIETFTKENARCPGELLIERKRNGGLVYDIGTSERTCYEVNWCCIVFELFRTSIEILSNKEDNSYVTVSQGNRDVSVVTSVSDEYDDVVPDNQVERRKKHDAREPVEHSYSEKCSSWLSSRITSMEISLDKDNASAIPEFGDKLDRILNDLKTDSTDRSDDQNYEALKQGDRVEHIYAETTPSDKSGNPDLISKFKDQLDRIERKMQEILENQQEGHQKEETLYAKFKETKNLMLQYTCTSSPTTHDHNTTRTHINMESVIQKNYTRLVESIDAQPLSDELFQEGFLSTEQHEKLFRMRKTDTAKDINRELLTFLRRVRISIDAFQKLLINCNHGHLVDMFR